MRLRKIQVLEKDPNKKGDLIARLMSDLFHSLGYDQPRLNISKSGREIDILSYHRTENKIAIAECKAREDGVGGAEINKFVGVLDGEKRITDQDRKGYSKIGYFISLSGFKQTAIEQEKEFGNDRVILINSEKLIAELIHGRILVSPEKAISSITQNISEITLMDFADLLVYEKGWVWAFYFSNAMGQITTHFALVHAEGKPLVQELAVEIVAKDLEVNKIFEKLNFINVSEAGIVKPKLLREASEKYFKYLENELGDVEFEGLPTDKESGTVKVKLESIFVPLHLNKSNVKEKRADHREGIGNILKTQSKLAILAKPGGGKSTLLKRIAIAYAFPERRKQINDDLPDKSWFPIFFRCRELGERVTLSITEIIKGIPVRAEIPHCISGFSLLASTSLQNGTALLLIDGLDEIADDKHRITFVNQLRTFIATYPSINIIVTSREAGFRVIAGALAAYCEEYFVAKLNNEEIKELTVKWHISIIDKTDNTIREANKLAELILKDSRIKVLATNPLLLTTLLFVKRWAGYLPTKRIVLYQEMIKLLLVTWNVEGHEILDIEEAEPQLAYVAYWMSKNGRQTITTDELNNCLIDSRKQLPEILGYTKVSPPEFIKRVELRSSILILSGHQVLDSGATTAIYEFLHLSFQEYLTAKAIVKKFVPYVDMRKKALQILKPHIGKENWKEVISLTAVLLERECKELIEYLVLESKAVAMTKGQLKARSSRRKNYRIAPILLGQCLANEVQISPSLLDKAIEWLAKSVDDFSISEFNEVILNNKFSEVFKSKVKDIYSKKWTDTYALQIGGLLSDIFGIEFKNKTTSINIFDRIDELPKCEQQYIILGVMNTTWELAYDLYDYEFQVRRKIKQLNKLFLSIFKKDDRGTQFAICWYLSFATTAKVHDEDVREEFVWEIFKIWSKLDVGVNLKNACAWALVDLLLPNFPADRLLKYPNLKKIIQQNFQKKQIIYSRVVAIHLGVILNVKFDQLEVKNVYKRFIDENIETPEELQSLKQFGQILKIDLLKLVAEA